MSHLNFKFVQSANLLSTAQRNWRGYTNGFRACLRECLGPAWSFPEHNSKIVQDISTKRGTHIKQEP